MPALRVILQELVLLGDGYVLNDSGYHWRAVHLLRWLQQNFPADLELHAQFVRQDYNGEGAIYEIDADGELISSVPLYWVDRRLPSPRAFEIHPSPEDQLP